LFRIQDVGKAAVLVFILLLVFCIGASQSVSAQSSLLFSWHGTVAPRGATQSSVVLVLGIEDGYGARIRVNASADVQVSIFDPSIWFQWSVEHLPVGEPLANYYGNKIDARTWFPIGGGWNVIISNPNEIAVEVTAIGICLEPPTLTMDAIPQSIVYGEPITVSGMITPPVSDGNVTLMATRQDSSTMPLLYLPSSIPENGKYALSWNPEAGKYELHVTWSGNVDYPSAKTKTAQLTVEQAKVKLMTNVSSKIRLDPVAKSPANVTVTGRLDPPINGAPITVSVENSNGLVQQLSTVTDLDGRFTTFVSVDRPGLWHVTVQWLGDSNHVSVNQTVPIDAEIGESYSQSAILGVVVAAAFSNPLILTLRPRKNNNDDNDQAMALIKPKIPNARRPQRSRQKRRKSKKQRNSMLIQLKHLGYNILTMNYWRSQYIPLLKPSTQPACPRHRQLSLDSQRSCY